MTTPRRCFTFRCTGVPTGNHWECEACRARIHAASEAATRRANPIKTARCRMGACADPKLAEVHWCSACRRTGIELRKAEQAKKLAGSVPNTRLGSELAEAAS